MGRTGKDSLGHNIAFFYLYRFTKFALVHVAVVVPFYRSRGLTFSQIMVVQSVYYLVKALLDVPTGALADSLGRRRTLVLGSLASAAAYLVIFGSRSLAMFMLGEGLSGLGMSLGSGADSAIAYDTLLAGGRSRQYQRVEGNAYALRLVAMGLFPIAGSALATLGLGWPYLASAAVILLSAALALGLREVAPHAPAGHACEDAAGGGPAGDALAGGGPPPGPAAATVAEGTPTRVPGSLRQWPARMLEGLGAVAGSPRLLWLTVYYTFVFAVVRCAFWLFQPFMEVVGLPLALFGPVVGGLSLFAALASRGADRLERLFGERAVLAGIPLVSAGAFLLMAAAPTLAGLGFLFLHQVPFGVHEPVVRAYTNSGVDSRVRATVLSVQSLGGNLAYALVSPGLGRLVDLAGLPGACRWLAGLALLGALPLGWWYWRRARPAAPVAAGAGAR